MLWLQIKSPKLCPRKGLLHWWLLDTRVAALCRTGLFDKKPHAYIAQGCTQLPGLWLTKRSAQLFAQYWCLARTTIPGRAKYARILHKFKTTLKQVQHRHGLMCSTTKATDPRVSSLQFSWSMLDCYCMLVNELRCVCNACDFEKIWIRKRHKVLKHMFSGFTR